MIGKILMGIAFFILVGFQGLVAQYINIGSNTAYQPSKPVDSSAFSKLYPWFAKEPIYGNRLWNDHSLLFRHTIDAVNNFRISPIAQTMRLGTLDRNHSIKWQLSTPYHQQLYLDGIPLNNPITQQVQWYLLPLERLSVLDVQHYGNGHIFWAKSRRYYVYRPRTELLYQEGGGTQTIDFLLTRAIEKQTNFEISYGYRTTEGRFEHENSTTNRVNTAFHYQPNNHHLFSLKGYFNTFDRQEPFGYTPDPNNPSNLIGTMPIESSAKSKENISLWSFHYRYRKNKKGVEDFRGVLWLKKYDYRLFNMSSIDNIGYKSTEIGVHVGGDVRTFFIEHKYRFQWTNSRLNGSGITFIDSTFNEFQFHYRMLLKLGKSIGVTSDLEWKKHSAKSLTRSANIDVQFSLLNDLTLNAYGYISRSSGIFQTTQWHSEDFNFNINLPSEEIIGTGITLDILLPFKAHLFLQGNYQATQGEAIVLDTTFEPSSYKSLWANATLSYASNNIGGNFSFISTFYDSYLSSSFFSHPFVNIDQQKAIKGEVYIQGYLFNRATWGRFGIIGYIAFDRHGAYSYYPTLQGWYANYSDFDTPIHHWTDIYLSARIRWFVITLQYENIFEQFLNHQIVETLPYLQPDSRFLFGIKVVFID